MRATVFVILLLGAPSAALAIQPKPTGEIPENAKTAAGATAPGAGMHESPGGEAPPEKVLARQAAQERYRRVKKARRQAFLAEARHFASLSESDVAGWRSDAAKPSPIATGDEDGSPMQFGRTLLIFSGVIGFLVLLIRYPPNRWPGWPRRSDDGSRGNGRRGGSRQDGPVTIKLKPRERRWSETTSRG